MLFTYFSLDLTYLYSSFDNLFCSYTLIISELNKLELVSVLTNTSSVATLTSRESLLMALCFGFGLISCAKHWQYSFQNPHNDAMFWMIDLHADIMVFLVFVVVLVFSLIIVIIAPTFYTKTTPVRVSLRKETFTHLEFIDLKVHNHDSFYEMIWTVIPILLEFFIILPSFVVHYAVSQTHPSYLEPKGITSANTIRIIGNQWYWVYHFISQENLVNIGISDILPVTVIESYLISPNESIIGTGLRMLEVDNPLFLQSGTFYKLLITSDDVIHSWAVPSLNIKVDACPGRLSEALLQTKDTGIFYGQCSEICGYYHGNMPIMIVIE